MRDSIYNGWMERAELVSRRVNNVLKGIPPYMYAIFAVMSEHLSCGHYATHALWFLSKASDQPSG